jgi:predicted RNA-binding protein (virulence factor B family)
MIAIGKYNTLLILRKTSVGLYLGDQETGEDVLLPNKYCPEEFELYEPIEVFVYRDNAERRIATTLTPDILLHEFALLQVVDVSQAGAFMDWGLEKQLFVPFAEQRQPMEVGQWHVVYLDIDPKTDRLYASAKIEQRLQNEKLTVAEGDAVDLLVFRETDLGFSVIVNQVHQGLVFHNEVFRELRVGERLKGFVKRIREENKLDISLQPIGYLNAIESNTDAICNALRLNDGFLPVTDKSAPDIIYTRFGMSKKAFKKAIGALYKERKSMIEEDGIRLL